MPSNKATSYVPTTWTKTVNGVERERAATSVSDEVAFKYDGWQQKPPAGAEKSAAATAKPATSAK